MLEMRPLLVRPMLRFAPAPQQTRFLPPLPFSTSCRYGRTLIPKSHPRLDSRNTMRCESSKPSRPMKTRTLVIPCRNKCKSLRHRPYWIQTTPRFRASTKQHRHSHLRTHTNHMLSPRPTPRCGHRLVFLHLGYHHPQPCLLLLQDTHDQLITMYLPYHNQLRLDRVQSSLLAVGIFLGLIPAFLPLQPKRLRQVYQLHHQWTTTL